MKWRSLRGAHCALCGEIGDGLQLKTTGAMLCFDCAWDAFRITEAAAKAHAKRAANAN